MAVAVRPVPQLARGQVGAHLTWNHRPVFRSRRLPSTSPFRSSRTAQYYHCPHGHSPTIVLGELATLWFATL